MLAVGDRQMRRIITETHGASPKALAVKYRSLRAAALLATRGPPAMDRAIAALNAIHAAGHHVIVSSDRPPATTQRATLDWLAKWRVSCDEVRLLGRGGKRQVLAAYGPDNPAVLIDDDPAKALTVARPGVQVWSPQRPWTPAAWQRYPNYWVFPSWTAVLERLGVPTDVPIPQFSRAAGPADTPHGEPATTHSEAP